MAHLPIHLEGSFQDSRRNYALAEYLLVLMIHCELDGDDDVARQHIRRLV